MPTKSAKYSQETIGEEKKAKLRHQNIIFVLNNTLLDFL